MIKKMQRVKQQYRVMVGMKFVEKKKEFNCVILESKTTIEKEADEQDENSLPKSKRMKREEEEGKT